jgi:hypothetical protein
MPGRHWIVVVAGLLSATSGLTPAAAVAASCARDFSGRWIVHQSNPLDVEFYGMSESNGELSGMAMYNVVKLDGVTYQAPGFVVRGPVSGRITGDHIEMRVHWNYGDLPIQAGGRRWGDGVYEGTIAFDGGVNGTNYEVLHPNAKVNWFIAPRPCKPARPIILPSQKLPSPGNANGGSNSPPHRPPVMLPSGSLPPIGHAPGGQPGSQPAGGNSSSNTPAPSTPASPRVDNDDPRTWMTGTFDTDFGKLVLSPTSGTYGFRDGRLTVRHLHGDVMEGIWEQSKSDHPCADGRF